MHHITVDPGIRKARIRGDLKRLRRIKLLLEKAGFEPAPPGSGWTEILDEVGARTGMITLYSLPDVEAPVIDIRRCAVEDPAELSEYIFNLGVEAGRAAIREDLRKLLHVV